MVRRGGGIGEADCGIGAEMPRQLDRELHARREFRKAFVDAELEEERAISMSQHDTGGNRRLASAQQNDLALAGCGERHRGAADEGGIALVLHQRGAALGLPAAGFDLQEHLDRGRDALGRARDVKTHRPMLGKPVTLTAQLLQFLGPKRFLQQFIGITAGIERGAQMRLQQFWTQAVAAQFLAERPHRATIERCRAQNQGMGPGGAPLLHELQRGGFRLLAVEQRRAQRAIGIGADQRRQRNFPGTPQRDDRQHSGQPRIAPGGKGGSIGAAARGGVHRQFPIGQIIAVWLDRAVGEHAPGICADGCERSQQGMRRRGIWHRCAVYQDCVGNIGHALKIPVRDGRTSLTPWRPSSSR